MALADRIIKVRASTGLGKQAFGKLFGVTHAAVDQWENGKTKSLKHYVVAKMEAETGFSAIWINTGKGPERADKPADSVKEEMKEYNAQPQSDPRAEKINSLSEGDLDKLDEYIDLLISAGKRSGN